MRFRDLVDRAVLALERAGATVLMVGPPSRRPFGCRIVSSEGSPDCLMFLWTITPGGGGKGVRPADERRIQLTNVQGFPLYPGARTIIGGWSEEFGSYALWDARRHSRFSPRSPSLQVSAQSLESAGVNGLSTYLRSAAQGLEVVVCAKPDFLLWYVQHGYLLHNADEDASLVEALSVATPEEERAVVDDSRSEAQASRRYELLQTVRAYRDARFRPAVLQAYSYRCAVCGYALKLVDAAHIVPIAHPQATDEVTNGIALCRLHHGAYDYGLVGVRSDYRVIVNTQTAQRLRDLRLDDGLAPFVSALPESIRLPASIEARPEPDLLRLGLMARNWPNSLVG